MSGIDQTQTLRADVVYPDSDGQPVAETGIHMWAIVNLIATLRQFYRARDDVYVTGDMFVYYEEGKPQSRRTPDVMVIHGVPSKPERRSFKVWVEGAVPNCIFEITSKATADEDREGKRVLYQRLGVREYFLFDPLHEYLDRPLMGYRLAGDGYESLEPGRDGGLVSQELGMRLVPEDVNLALFLSGTGERIPAPPEAYQLLEEAQRKADNEQRRTEKERRRAEKERRRAEKAEQRASALEHELERLRALLPPSSGESSPTNGGPAGH